MLLTNAAHVLIAATALSIPFALMDGTLFAWHPTLMSLGFLGLMAEGVLTSISFRSLEGSERLNKIWVHLAWQAAAVVCIVGGFWAIYQNKVNHDKLHFQSVHGKFGLATFTFAMLATIGGVLSFRRFGLINKLPELLQPRVKWAHRNVGIAVWLMSLLTVELALTKDSVWKGFLSVFWQIAVALLGFLVVALWSDLASQPSQGYSPQGLLSVAWQGGTALMGVAVLAYYWRQGLEAKRKLPLYQDTDQQQYGIVTAADELDKTL